MGFKQLSPWDSFAWFDTPTVAVVAVAPPDPIQLVTADVRRVALWIYKGSAAPDVSVGPIREVTLTNGIPLLADNIPLRITHNNDGPLVQMEWWAVAFAGLNVMTIEVKLRDWPEDIGEIYHAKTNASPRSGNISNRFNIKQARRP